MATYGYSLINQAGITLVREDELVAVYRTKLTYANASLTRILSVDTGIADTEAFIIPVCRGTVATFEVFKSGGRWKMNIQAQSGTIYIFGPAVSAGGYGIRLYNSAGKLAYQNNGNAIKFIGLGAMNQQYSQTIGIVSFVYQVITVPPSPGQTTVMMNSIIAIAGTTNKISTMTIVSGTDANTQLGYTNTVQGNSVFVVDVTGL